MSKGSVPVNEDNLRESSVWRRTEASRPGSGKNAKAAPADRTKEVKGNPPRFTLFPTLPAHALEDLTSNMTLLNTVVTVGEASVGKTSITVRFVHNQFKEHTISTIGASFLTKTIYINGCWCKFNVWDTAGQG